MTTPKRNTDFFLKERIAAPDILKVAISKRITDDDNKPVLFEFQAISPEKVEAARQNARIIKRDARGNVETETFDVNRFAILLAIDCCIFPNFKEKKLIDAHGVRTPYDLVTSMLTVEGELTRLADAVMSVNEIGVNFQTLVDEAKN